MRWCAVVRALVSAVCLAILPLQVHADEIYWGAYVHGGAANPALIDALEGRVGKGLAIVQWGSPWWHEGRYYPFQTSYFQTVRDRGSIPLIDWSSWDFCCEEEQPQFRLNSIYNGAHDAHIHQWARDAQAWGHPFFIRFDPEMNGWWLPWSEQTNGNRAGDFVRMWRHVVDIFRQEGTTNATWVWCPNIVGPRSTPMTELYPGDEYVDWLCMDGYNWGIDRDNAGYWSFEEVFAGSWYNGYFNTYEQLRQMAPGKPIMVGETSSSERGGSKAAWIREMLISSLPNAFPDVKAFLWFDWDLGDPRISWPIASSAESLGAFAEGIALPFYASNRFAALDDRPIPALTSALVSSASD